MDVSLTFEECARRILQRELAESVALHDDGSAPGLYDLRVGTVESPTIAIECVGAVDSVRTETWNTGPAKGPLTCDVSSDWWLVLKPHARVSRIRRSIEQILRSCEAAGFTGRQSVDWSLQHRYPEIFSALNDLQIDSLARFGEPGTGQVHLTITGLGGAVDIYGFSIPTWIAEFLAAPEQADVITKLERSGAARRHVFVGVSFGGVPWQVKSYLGTDTDHVPSDAPVLPDAVDGVWIMYGRRGLRWDGNPWRQFNAIIPAV